VTRSSDAIATILKAAQFAARKHKYQRRKDAASSPCINHPLALANILREEGKVDDVRVIVAALLHDTIEDTETDYDEIRGQFGDEVAEMVAEVTDTKWLKKRSRKLLQISKAARASNGAKLVKLATRSRMCGISSPVRLPTGQSNVSASISTGRRLSSISSAAQTRAWSDASTGSIDSDLDL
jgi:GTP diphosphokinase / guanosine-3',5'-bis(diphosphate) 3'-diphosphatase